MITFIHQLLIFIKGSFHYGVINHGLGDFAPKAIVLPLNPKLHPRQPHPENYPTL